MSVTQLVSEICLKDSISFTLNTEFLNHNFSIVKQCLLKIKDLEGNLDKYQQNSTKMDDRLKIAEQKLKEQGSDLNSCNIKVKELSTNVGDQFLKKMYAIQEKTKNMFDFDQTVRRLEGLDKFVKMDEFRENKNQTKKQIEKAMKLREEFDRYLLNSDFQKYKQDQERCLLEKQGQIDNANQQIAKLEQIIQKLTENVSQIQKDVKGNADMIKEINFTEMLDKIKKFKEDIQQKIHELQKKMKKKVSTSQLAALQKNMIEKLDKFLGQNQKSKAEKQQTKQALLFLLRKLNEIEDIVSQKMSEEDKDAMFATKKWQCASCTKDLGKFEGKLGQFKPWSVFPCKQLDPEKTGGFGYLNYIDKMAYRKGYDMEESNMERLSKTFYESKDKDSPSKKLGTTRASNLISNFGSEERGGSSLKESYFKQIQSERGDRTSNKLFRVVRKQLAKPLPQEQAKQE